MSDEVLPNRLGITDARQLAEYELEVAAARVAEIARDPERFTGAFDFAHLQRIHAHVLQDVYEWADNQELFDWMQHSESPDLRALPFPGHALAA